MSIEFQHMPASARRRPEADGSAQDDGRAGQPQRPDRPDADHHRGHDVVRLCFAVLALIALPSAAGGGLLALIQWLSQTFIQLVMLSVIMVGQNIQSRASDRRSDMTYQDADATLHEAGQIQAHLQLQDDALNALLAKVERLEAALAQA